MAATAFYTQQQLSDAKIALDNLPDLTPDRLTRSNVLSSLKEQILTLHRQKGYSAADIKSALDTAGITVGLKAIQDMVARPSPGRRTPGKNATASRTTHPPAETKPQKPVT